MCAFAIINTTIATLTMLQMTRYLCRAMGYNKKKISTLHAIVLILLISTYIHLIN